MKKKTFILPAMVFERQYNWKIGNDKGSVADSDDGVFEQNVRAHGFAVSYDWLLVFAFPIPAIELDAPTAS